MDLISKLFVEGFILVTKPISKRITVQNGSQAEFKKLTDLVLLIDKSIQDTGKPWYFRATNNASEIRSIAQNALYACYVEAVRKHFGDSHSDTRKFLKRKFGLTTMYLQSQNNTKAGHDALSVINCLRVVNYKLQPFHTQEAILEPLPCTSIFTSKSFCVFLREVEIHYAEKGLVLESINETLRNEALLN